MRRRSCVSCEQARRPYCLAALPSLHINQTCIIFHVRRTNKLHANFCQLTGCPRSTKVNELTRTTSSTKPHIDYCTINKRKVEEKSNYAVEVVVSTVVVLVLFITIALTYCWCVSKISDMVTDVVASCEQMHYLS